MEMATFVYVGEYSTACACRPLTAGAVGQADHTQAATIAAAAGVEMQRRSIEEQQRAASRSLTMPTK